MISAAVVLTVTNANPEVLFGIRSKAQRIAAGYARFRYKPPFLFPLRCSLKRKAGGIVVAKTFAKLIIGIAALAAATWFGTSPSHAYGDAPWCAVKTLSGDVYWNCQYRTVEECAPNVVAGDRGFCALNPWPRPSQVVPSNYQYKKPYAR